MTDPDPADTDFDPTMFLVVPWWTYVIAFGIVATVFGLVGLFAWCSL